MQKFEIKVKRKNGNERTVTVYLDDITADLLKQTGDTKLLETYLREEYKTSRRSRQEEYWNQSLDEDMRNGIDYEDKRSYDEYSFDDFDDKALQAAFKLLTPRQQEILRLMYIEGRTQREIAKIFGVGESAISHAIDRIYASIQKNYKKK